VASPPATPAVVAPAALANTGPGAVVSKGTIIGLMLALLGSVCLFAGRRPATGGRHSA
jgi:LPXTG-motif cell wall-anchored protein